MPLAPFIVMALASLVTVGLAMAVFRAEPATRRLFIIVSALTLLVVPALCLIAELSWTIGLEAAAFSVPGSVSGMVVPDLVWVVLALVGFALIGQHAVLVCRQRAAIARLPLATDGRVQSMLAELERSAGVGAPVEVRLGGKACSSSIGGGVIVLPADWDDWSESTLRAVLAHELVHISRSDDRWAVLLTVVGKAFWWLPWLSLLSALFDKAMEESCDDLAAALLRSEHAYLAGVFQVATGHRQVHAATTPLNGGSLVERFRRFNQPRQQELDSRGLYWASLLLCLSIAGLSAARFEVVLPGEGRDLRVVARTERDDSEMISLRLKEKPPAPLEVVSGHDPPR